MEGRYKVMIIETCPRCGADLVTFVLTCDPPVPKKECLCCGWSWTGEPEEITRVPFGEDTYVSDQMTFTLRHNPVKLSDSSYDYSPCRTCSNNPANGGSGICYCTLGQPEIT